MAVKIDPAQNTIKFDTTIKSSVATFTRPNNVTAYASGNVVGTSPATVMTFSNVGTAGSGIEIVNATLEMDATVTPANIFLHLFSIVPTAIADQVAINIIAGDRPNYLGWISFPANTQFGSVSWCQLSQNISKGTTPTLSSKLATTSTSLFGQMSTTSIWTPVANMVHTITLYVRSL